ncbi:MAG: transposase [Tannerellaceae bacterium]|nr:transposase [Tannerellaceae bacterium]MCD8262897.1 transposase [Tannerellaceae bacterium]
MAQSLTKIYVHIIFHIKNQGTFIKPENHKELYSYMAGVIKNNDSIPFIINGTTDHVHVLCILSKNIPLSTLVQQIKQSSSRWLKSQDIYYRGFQWQGGYGAFSVSSSTLDKTVRYISNQQEHHT